MDMLSILFEALDPVVGPVFNVVRAVLLFLWTVAYIGFLLLLFLVELDSRALVVVPVDYEGPVIIVIHDSAGMDEPVLSHFGRWSTMRVGQSGIYRLKGELPLFVRYYSEAPDGTLVEIPGADPPDPWLYVDRRAFRVGITKSGSTYDANGLIVGKRPSDELEFVVAYIGVGGPLRSPFNMVVSSQVEALRREYDGRGRELPAVPDA